MKHWYRFRGLLLLVVAEMERTDRHTHTHTHTHTQDNYCNPRCACAPRVNKLICGRHNTTYTRPYLHRATACVTPHVHSTCTSYVLYTYLYCVYVLVGGTISIRDPYICAIHESVPMSRTLLSTGPLSVQ